MNQPLARGNSPTEYLRLHGYILNIVGKGMYAGHNRFTDNIEEAYHYHADDKAWARGALETQEGKRVEVWPAVGLYAYRLDEYKRAQKVLLSRQSQLVNVVAADRLEQLRSEDVMRESQTIAERLRVIDAFVSRHGSWVGTWLTAEGKREEEEDAA